MDLLPGSKKVKERMIRVLTMILTNIRVIVGVVLMATGCYLVCDSCFGEGKAVSDMRAWLEETGDAELKAYYANLTDERELRALGAAFRTYRHRYGETAWVKHFKDENRPGGEVAYMDLAELAVGMFSAEDRNEYLEQHAAIYDACVRSGLSGVAHDHVAALRELKAKGGADWKVAAKNSFAVSVYLAVKDDPSLWSWYLDNWEWCDSYLEGLSPEDFITSEWNVDGKGFKGAVASVREHQALLKRFHSEIEKLSDDELTSLADDDDELAKSTLHFACMAFVENYGPVLEALRKEDQEVPMLEAMSVLANNHDAFDLSTPEACRSAARELSKIRNARPGVWNRAMEDSGAGVVKLDRVVPQWSEQIVGEFGDENVATFLLNYYKESDSDDLLRVAGEIVYRCHEPGFAVLQRFRDHGQFKELMKDKKIGFRIVPYYLKFGDKVFSELVEDPRWMDEIFDKDGHLKRKDVSWYEVSDIATVVKKWIQDRPVSNAELGWAAFEVADIALMAFTAGGSKAASTAGKAAAKGAAKRVATDAGKKIGVQAVRKIECKIVGQGAKRIVGQGAKVAVRRMSTVKRVTRLLKGGVQKSFGKASKIWDKVRKLPPRTRAGLFKAAKGMMLAKMVYSIADKGPDIVRTWVKSLGETSGRFVNAVVEGAGEGFKAAIREALGVERDSGIGRLFEKYLWILLGVVLIFFGWRLSFDKRRALA